MIAVYPLCKSTLDTGMRIEKMSLGVTVNLVHNKIRQITDPKSQSSFGAEMGFVHVCFMGLVLFYYILFVIFRKE